MDLSPTFVIETANRLGAAAQNVMEVARFGGLETDEEPSPFEVLVNLNGRKDALGQLDEVSLAVAYGVASGPVGVDAGAELVVAAVTRSGGRQLDPTRLTEALSGLPPAERPSVIHVVDDIDRTAWFRLRKFALRQAGLPSGGEQFHLDRESGSYSTTPG